MRYTLEGVIQTSYSHDADKERKFKDYFDTEDPAIAFEIARAMVQSQQIKKEAAGNSVGRLEASLRDERSKVLWSTKLVAAVGETKTVVVKPERFLEVFHVSS